MAYSPKSIPVVAGGLMLALPGDIIDDDSSQELLNFSTDSLGALKSRRGHRLYCSAGGAIINQIRGLGNRWQADGGNVSKECGAVIGNGGTGLASWKDFVIACDGNEIRKSDGSSDWPLIPEPPTAAPAIVAAEASEKDVVTFDGGWTVTPDDDETTPEIYDPTLKIQNAGASVWLLEKSVGVDLGTNHSLDDVQKITVWSKRWPSVVGITFEVDVNDGTFEKDIYRGVMTVKNIKVGKREEVSFYIRKRPLPVDRAAKDKKNYPSFERIGSTAGKDWGTVVAIRIKLECSGPTKVRFDAWKNVGDVDNTLEGDDFMACYTYVTDAGHESNPSPFSAPITLNRVGFNVSGMVVSGDDQVTGMRVYVTGGTLQGVYTPNATPIPQATEYQFRASDDDLTGLNLQLEADHDTPPSASGLIAPYYNRLIAWKGSRYYWSHTNKLYAFAAPDDESGGDWEVVDQGLGDIMAATMRPGALFFHCQNGVMMVQGDPGDQFSSAQHRCAAQGGIQSRQGVVQSPHGDYQAQAKGVFLFTGDSAEEISRKIQPAFKDGWNSGQAAIGFGDNVVWVSDRSRTFRWDRLTDRFFEDSRVFSSFYWDGGSLLGGTPSGEIVELESGFTDDGAPFPVRWLSKDYDCGLQDDEKRFGDFSFWANTGGADLLVEAVLSSPGQVVALGTINSSGETRFVLPFSADGEGIDARRCAIRVTGSVSSECVLHSMELWFYPKAREGKSFDTGEQSYGDHRVKIMREQVWDIDSPAAVAITLKSDRPQPMADRDTSHSIAVTSDRRMQPVVFDDSEIIGRLFRTVLHGDDFRCYGGKALIQVIGTYLEGGDGEYYLSDVLDFGTERVKFGRELEVVYSMPSGSAVFTVETELPGDTLAIRETFNLDTTVGEETRKLRLHNTVKGRLWRYRVDPTAAMRIEAIRFRGKIIGEPNATPWQWFLLPVLPTQDAIWMPIDIPPDQLG